MDDCIRFSLLVYPWCANDRQRLFSLAQYSLSPSLISSSSQRRSFLPLMSFLIWFYLICFVFFLLSVVFLLSSLSLFLSLSRVPSLHICVYFSTRKLNHNHKNTYQFKSPRRRANAKHERIYKENKTNTTYTYSIIHRRNRNYTKMSDRR